MIIKLTPAEIKNYVGDYFGLNPGEFELEIVSPPDTSLLAALRQVVNRYPGCDTYDKVPAVKAFRELAPKQADHDGHYSSVVGLADAKWAVENPTVALANLERTGNIRG